MGTKTTQLSLRQPDAAVVRGVTGGSRFKIFVQNPLIEGFEEPETITVSIPGGGIRAGPSDDRMFVVDAVDKPAYGEPGGGGGPPYTGRRNPPVQPDREGNFDYLPIKDRDGSWNREFLCATMYATVRRVLDIWESYFGHPLEWVWKDNFKRLELIPTAFFNNAQSGAGFIEFGSDNEGNPYCINFDVLAHEEGHQFIYSVVGFPNENNERVQDEFGGFHESSGDIVAMIAGLHFNKLVDHLLAKSFGNLYGKNELERLGEVTQNQQIREASNPYTMLDYPGHEGREPHDMSVPLTGAIFDILVEVYQRKLVQLGAISPQLAQKSFHEQVDLDDQFKAAYEQNPGAFKTALLEARDYLGDLLATCWSSLDPNKFSYSYYAKQLLAADRKVTGGHYQDTISTCFTWRKIRIPFTLGNLRHGACLTARTRDAQPPTAEQRHQPGRAMPPRVGTGRVEQLLKREASPPLTGQGQGGSAVY